MSAVLEAQPNSPAVYDPISRALHWLTVLLVAAEYVVGSVMPSIHHGTPLGTMIKIHLALGSGLLLLVVLRIVWRVTHRPPPAPPQPLWQQRLAGLTHVALYLTLILMPLAGWASASARGWPVRGFGVVPLPALVPQGKRIGFLLGDVHADVLYWILLGLIAVHVGAALYHRLVKRDSVLGRMLPGW
jgi:cytochrome b561